MDAMEEGIMSMRITEADMAEIIYAIWQLKPEFLPPGVVAVTMYTEFGSQPVDVERWSYPLRSGEPSKYVARDVRIKGFSLHVLSAENSARMGRLYKKRAA